tara:strand:+ start:4364 stop:4714 length:351 start_codon:yes stop_codon:yes gene_type:complete
MQRKSLLWLTLFPLFLLQGCGGGGGGVITYDAQDGSVIRVKKETVSCRNEWGYTGSSMFESELQKCTVAGIRTDLLGEKNHWTDSTACASSYEGIINQNTIVCQSVNAVGIEPNFD